jgi:hypothetical protein
MELSSDEKMRQIEALAREFFEQALSGEYEPFFVGDEATIWDVSMEAPEELLRRCSEHYRTTVSLEDLRQPLWKLIRQLDERRNHPAA